MKETRILPLFPLSSVLFPGAVLPLRIFESRYQALLRRCLAGDRIFGVVLIRQGQEVGPDAVPYDIGTVARIVRTEPLKDGQVSVTVVGERRFRIQGMVDGEPYPQGTVEWLPDQPVAVTGQLVARVGEQFAAYVELLRQLAHRPGSVLSVPEGALELSYVVAANLQISRGEQQTLLEASVGERLRQEDRVLRRELLLLQHLGAVTTRRLRSPTDFPSN
jgi:Lon protease-like protein